MKSNLFSAERLSISSLKKAERSIERLNQDIATGKKSNTASNDPASVAIAGRMDAQIRSHYQAIRNMNDAISLIQTADAAVGSITNIYHRIRELMVRSNNDTNADEDRAAIQTEIDILQSEVNSIAETTVWNEMKLLDGSGGDGWGMFSFQNGADVGDQISLWLPNVKTHSWSSVDDDFYSNTHYFDFSYYQVINEAVTWTEAKNAASSMDVYGFDGHLVTISDNFENIFVTSLVAQYVTTGWNNSAAWIGASDADDEGQWKWVTGPESGTTFWSGDGSGSAVDASFVAPWYASEPSNESAASGLSGYWSNPTSTGSDFAFIYGSIVPGLWDDAYSSVTASSTLSSPIASSEGMRNAYVIEYEFDYNPPFITPQNIDDIDGILSSLNYYRAEFGSYINRLNFSIEYTTRASIKMESHRSNLQDTDYSLSIGELTKNKIIAQASIAMLAQANQSKYSILQLFESFR